MRTEPTTLSEAVARAIYEAHTNEHTPAWDDRQVLDDMLCQELAQAAIRAVLEGIMEPTPGVSSAGVETFLDPMVDRPSGQPRRAWQAMVRHLIERECGEGALDRRSG